MKLQVGKLYWPTHNFNYIGRVDPDAEGAADPYIPAAFDDFIKIDHDFPVMVVRLATSSSPGLFLHKEDVGVFFEVSALAIDCGRYLSLTKEEWLP